MRSFPLLLLFTGIGLVCHSQQDTALVNRINAMLHFTKTKEYEKILDYTYPKLFDIVPREALVESLQENFDTDEFSIQLDSIELDPIFPVFVIRDTSYVVAKHTMLMKMMYKEPFDTANAESTQMLVNLMEIRFGKGNVRFDKINNSLNIYLKPDVVGIKAKSDSWTFVNLNEDNPLMLGMLFNAAVVEKLKEFK